VTADAAASTSASWVLLVVVLEFLVKGGLEVGGLDGYVGAGSGRRAEVSSGLCMKRHPCHGGQNGEEQTGFADAGLWMKTDGLGLDVDVDWGWTGVVDKGSRGRGGGGD
jgi:hypothetical protein